MCHAAYLWYYCLTQSRINGNDYQTEKVKNKLIQGNHPFRHIYRKLIPLMSSKEKLKCRNIPNVLQY